MSQPPARAPFYFPGPQALPYLFMNSSQQIAHPPQSSSITMQPLLFNQAMHLPLPLPFNPYLAQGYPFYAWPRPMLLPSTNFPISQEPLLSSRQFHQQPAPQPVTQPISLASGISEPPPLLPMDLVTLLGKIDGSAIVLAVASRKLRRNKLKTHFRLATRK